MGTGTINRDTVAVFDRSSAKERRIISYTGSASYATGGETFNPETISLKVIEAMPGVMIANAARTTVYWGYWDATAKKILFYSATGTQIPNATDLSGFTGAWEVIGR